MQPMIMLIKHGDVDYRANRMIGVATVPTRFINPTRVTEVMKFISLKSETWKKYTSVRCRYSCRSKVIRSA